jgi:HsdM-like protein
MERLTSVLEHRPDLDAHAVFGDRPVLRDQILILDLGSRHVLEPLVRWRQATAKNGVVKALGDPNLSSFIWAVADLLQGDYKQSDYGKVILPFTVLRRLDCVLEPTKVAVLAENEKRMKENVNAEPFLLRNSTVHFIFLGHFVRSLLFGVSATDGLTIVVVIAT